MAEPEDPSLPEDGAPEASEPRESVPAHTAEAEPEEPVVPAVEMESVAEAEASAEEPVEEPIPEPEIVVEAAPVEEPVPAQLVAEPADLAEPPAEITAEEEPEPLPAYEPPETEPAPPVMAEAAAEMPAEEPAEDSAEWTLAADDAVPPPQPPEPEPAAPEPIISEVEPEPIPEPEAPAEPEPVIAAAPPEPEPEEEPAPEPVLREEVAPPEPEPVPAPAFKEPETFVEEPALFDAPAEPEAPAAAEPIEEPIVAGPHSIGGVAAEHPPLPPQEEIAAREEAAPITSVFEQPLFAQHTEEPVEAEEEAFEPDAESSEEPELAAAARVETPASPDLVPAEFSGGDLDPYMPPAEPTLGDRISAGVAAFAASLTAFFAAIAARMPTIETWRSLKPPTVNWEAPLPRLRAPEPPSWRNIALFSGIGVAVVVSIIAGFFIYVTWGMPSTKDLWAAGDAPSLTFVDRHGRVILREGAQNAPPVDIDRLPKYIPESVIAIEDRRFYKHMGVDVGGLIRAATLNMRAGHVVQGGSTLTQQLAKNLFLTNERTWRRKAQEIALAFWLESQFSKKQILALYLSRVYFGAGAWGIDAASERYFDKPANKLTLAEAALLAGLVKAPSNLNPARQDTAAKARAKIVLDEMLSGGYITAKQHAAALKAPLAISRSNPNGNLGYFRDWIDPQLNRVIGDQRDDFIVETTLDLDAQRAGERALDGALETEGKLKDVGQGALLSMDSTGGVRAMVGGRSYGKDEGQSEFNRTTQSRRAPGSSFKYFIYMTAMAMGYTPWTVRVDEPIVIGDWAPGNYENKFYGPVTLAQAYAKSLNMVAIEVAHEVGGENVIATAEKLGVKTKLYNYRSLALGAQGLSLMEMVTAYGAMANDGVRVEPHGITRIKRANGQVMWAYRTKKADPVIDERTKRLMNFLGTRVVQAGTGTKAQIPGREIAGKTGTSNDYRDAWFMGYVPGLVSGVWVGNDNYSQMKKVTGGSIPTQVWHEFMLTALRDTPFRPLDMPRDEDMPAAELVEPASEATLKTTGAPLIAPGPEMDMPPASGPGGDG